MAATDNVPLIRREDIKHRTECVPSLFRTEIYEFEDLVYTEWYDDSTGERLFGDVKMYDGIKVCSVNADGTIAVNMPTGWVTNHKDMLCLAADIKKLDGFIAAVCEEYR